MTKIFGNSLLVRMGLAMATITILAFISMVSSMLITEATQGEAGAINQAGTLRMQSYRITTQIALHNGPGPASGSHSDGLYKLVKEFEVFQDAIEGILGAKKGTINIVKRERSKNP